MDETVYLPAEGAGGWSALWGSLRMAVLMLFHTVGLGS
jgi:hypothetical protein